MTDKFVELCRNLGAARLDLAEHAATQDDWRAVNVSPFPFAFTWSACWKANVGYKVVDIEAELGFYLGILGMSILSFDKEFIMLCSEDGYCISLSPATDKTSTAAESLSFEFMIENIQETSQELVQRGVTFEVDPAAYGGEGSPLLQGTLRTPHGIAIRLWGMTTEVN